MSVVERRYARALLDCAATPERADAFESALDSFCRAMAAPDARMFFGSPVTPAKAKKGAVKEFFRDSEPELRNFMLLLADKRRLLLLPGIADEYRVLKQDLRGVLRIRVRSAAPLSPEQTERIGEQYKAQFGAAEAAIEVDVDESLLGGICVQVGDMRVDDTIRARLKRMFDTIQS